MAFLTSNFADIGKLGSFPYQNIFEEITIPTTGSPVHVPSQPFDKPESELVSHTVSVEAFAVSNNNYSDAILFHIFSSVCENVFDTGEVILVRVDTLAFRRSTNLLVVSAREI